MSLCDECKMNEIVNGCGVSVNNYETKKGIGVVGCKYFMEFGDLLQAQKIKNEIVSKRD